MHACTQYFTFVFGVACSPSTCCMSVKVAILWKKNYCSWYKNTNPIGSVGPFPSWDKHWRKKAWLKMQLTELREVAAVVVFIITLFTFRSHQQQKSCIVFRRGVCSHQKQSDIPKEHTDNQMLAELLQIFNVLHLCATPVRSLFTSWQLCCIMVSMLTSKWFFDVTCRTGRTQLRFSGFTSRDNRVIIEWKSSSVCREHRETRKHFFFTNNNVRLKQAQLFNLSWRGSCSGSSTGRTDIRELS